MIRHHTGSGRRTVIPADWSAHHRQVFDGTRDATVTLRRPGGTKGAFDPVTGTYPVTPHPAYYTGGARIQILTGTSRDVLAAEQQVTTLRYSVLLDDTVDGAQVEDLCRVTAMTDNGDQTLIDRDLTVEAVVRGSLHWERRLVCTDDLEVA